MTMIDGTPLVQSIRNDGEVDRTFELTDVKTGRTLRAHRTGQPDGWFDEIIPVQGSEMPTVVSTYADMRRVTASCDGRMFEESREGTFQISPDGQFRRPLDDVERMELHFIQNPEQRVYKDPLDPGSPFDL